MFDCNVKIIKVSNTVNDYSIIGFPQDFAFSLIIKNNNNIKNLIFSNIYIYIKIRTR